MKWLQALLMFLMGANANAAHVVSKTAGIDLDTYKVVHLEGPINNQTYYTAGLEMIRDLSLPGDILVIINSQGGSVDIGEEIIKTLMQVKGNNHLICMVKDEATSMAFNILTFCDVRLSTASAHFIVHKVAAGMVMGRMTAKNLREAADDIDAIDEPFRRANAKATHLSLTSYDKYADDETNWSALQLRAMGYLDAFATLLGE